MCACSVKENRTSCPSYITLDVSAYREYSDSAYVHLQDQAHEIRDTIDLEAGQVSREWASKKGMIVTYVFSNLDRSREKNGIVHIPPGEQADPLRAFCRRFECYEEIEEIKAEPDRQSALVHLKFKNVKSEVFPYELEVISDICGIDLKGLTPVKGEFRYKLELDSEMSCKFYLPRQLPSSTPVIYLSYEGVHIDTLPFHSWIKAAYYDWESSDLQDIHIEIDQGMIQVSFMVDEWIQAGFYEVIF